MIKEVPIGDALRFGWETFKANAFFLIGLFVAISLVSAALEQAGERVDGGLQEFAVNVIHFFVGMLLELGVIVIALKFRDGERPEFADLFNRLALLPYFAGATIVYSLMVVLGLFLFIVPGVYFAARFHFYGYFIAEYGVGPLEAFHRSSALTEGVRLQLVLYWLAVLGVVVLGLLAFIVGVFVSMPVCALATAYIYRHLHASLERPVDGGPVGTQG